MKLKTKIVPHTLYFKRPAQTSRGVYNEHHIWYVIVFDEDNPEHWGIGECAPLFDLSCDYCSDYEQVLRRFCHKLEIDGCLDMDTLRPYPSILFGLETALKHFGNQNFALWNTSFSAGNEGIPINGLIWMGSFEYMYEQIEAKLNEGYTCIKLKIGAIDFQKELELLQHIRKRYSAHQITLRVDANGAFSNTDALEKLKLLSDFDLHSIEQPIKAGQWQTMRALCENTPLPIALDEELIGINNRGEKKKMLETIQPQFIILKPTLHGGIKGSEEWIELAEQMGINWWITSALESNVGLNAIAQWTSSLCNPLPQGLGTGALYVENIDLPLSIHSGKLWYTPNEKTMHWDEIIRYV